MQLKKHPVGVLIFIILITSCTSDTPPSPDSVANNNEPYPIVDILPMGYPVIESPTSEKPAETLNPNYLPTPQAGFSSISGFLQTPVEHKAIVSTAFYLAQGLGENSRTPPPVLSEPSILRGDIVGTTAGNGAFVLQNIPPGTYYMFVWAPYDWRPVQVSESDSTPRLLELAPNQGLPLGNLYVTWP
jgi:hypothetical protein